jgi:hypothetical protein
MTIHGAPRATGALATSMADIFISYSKVHILHTEELATALQEKGFTVWWDTRLVAGDNFKDVILAELEQARAAIVIWTSESIKSEWVYSEARRAHARRILIPVRSEEVGANDIPPPFDALHTVPLTERAAIEGALAQLGVTPAPEMCPSSGSFEEKTRTVRRNVQVPYKKAAQEGLPRVLSIASFAIGGSIIAFALSVVAALLHLLILERPIASSIGSVGTTALFTMSALSGGAVGCALWMRRRRKWN